MIDTRKFKMDLPPSVSKIIEILEHSGYEACCVGGCVRDAFLGKTPHDYDICTSATPEQMKEAFRRSKNKTYDTGLQHGTISVLSDKELLEVTTYRIDGDYKDGRHPETVQFVDDITKDLARRDFTINAMAYNPQKGLIDPFGGVNDCENKIIKCVGDPNKRFNEDALRILRAIRFAATNGFWIEPETETAMNKHKHLLQNVSAERNTMELLKILTHADYDLMMNNRDIFAEYLPELKPMFGFGQHTPWHMYDVWEHTVRAIELAPKDVVVRLTMLLHDIGKPNSFTFDEQEQKGHFHNHNIESLKIAETILKRMRLDNETVNQVKCLIEYHDAILVNKPTRIKRILNQIGKENFDKLVDVQLADKQAYRLTREQYQQLDETQMSEISKCIKRNIEELDQLKNAAEKIIARGECYQMKDLAINGSDLIELGMLPGKEMGALLKLMLDKVICEPELNQKELLIREVKTITGKDIDEEIQISR